MKRPFIAALLAAAFLVPAAPAAASTWEDTSYATALREIDSAPSVPGHVAAKPMPAVRTAITAATPFFINFIETGYSQSNLPCFSCVNGGQSDTLGTSVPYNYVYQGSYQNYLISWTSLNFSGNCRVAFTITAGKTLIDKFGYTFTGIGDGAFDAWFDRAATGYSGPALVTGKLYCWGSTTRTLTAKVPVLFQ